MRYFVAVAEELHFGRAASRLNMSQPPLSRAIGQLERRLGTLLFVRANRSVSLTAAGETLLNEARKLLVAVDRAERRVQEAAAGAREVVLAARTGAKPVFVRELLERYEEVPGRLPIRIVLSQTGEQGQMVRDGRADVALLHPPLDDTNGLELEEFCVEGQVAILPLDHPLGSRQAVTLSEFAERADAPICDWSPIKSAPAESDAGVFADLTGLAQLVALGRAAAILPSSVAAQLPHDLAMVEVSDAEPVTMAIAWSSEGQGPGARDLLAAAHAVRDAYLRTSRPPRLRAA